MREDDRIPQENLVLKRRPLTIRAEMEARGV